MDRCTHLFVCEEYTVRVFLHFYTCSPLSESGDHDAPGRRLAVICTFSSRSQRAPVLRDRYRAAPISVARATSGLILTNIWGPCNTEAKKRSDFSRMTSQAQAVKTHTHKNAREYMDCGFCLRSIPPVSNVVFRPIGLTYVWRCRWSTIHRMHRRLGRTRRYYHINNGNA